MISDLHIHTRLSCDASQDIENDVAGIVKLASERNISYIGITEHCDIIKDDPDNNGIINADLDECARQVCAEKARLLEDKQTKVSLIHGIEIAHQHLYPGESAKILSAHNYDFVLGSLHLLKDRYDFYFGKYKELSEAEIKSLLLRYLGELYEIASSCDFDSFAHCTYPLRYIYRCGRLEDMCKNPIKHFKDEYADIFKKIISRGKALELNTSGLRRGGFTNPGYDLLSLYKDLGGKYVTTGSDSHERSTVGSGIDVAENMLKELGFDGVTVYIARQPKLILFN